MCNTNANDVIVKEVDGLDFDDPGLIFRLREIAAKALLNRNETTVIVRVKFPTGHRLAIAWDRTEL